MGIAGLTAVVLAVIIEVVFHKEVIADVTRAALGHLLPPDLRDELRWIYEQQFVCTDHRQRCRLTCMGDMVRVHVDILRIIQNISERSHTFAIGLAIDDWGFAGGASEIIRLAYRVEGGAWQEITQRVPFADGIRTSERTVDIAAGKSIEIQSIYEVTRRLNDEYSEIFSWPTRNPEVTVTADPGLHPYVRFAHRKQGEVAPSPDGWNRLQGTLLPLQRITIRWYPEDVDTTDRTG